MAHQEIDGEIPYADVTQDDVISWVKSGFVGIVTVGVGRDAVTTNGIELDKKCSDRPS